MNVRTRILAALLPASLAALAWSSVLAQCYWAATAAANQGTAILPAVINVLSYFTILTNVLVGLVLTVVSVRGTATSRRFPTVSQQTAVASYILIVGVVYELLLRRLWNPAGWRFVSDMILHNIVPVGYLLYWLLAVPKGQLRYGQLWRWTIYPFAYLVYCLVRGHWDRFFPYPFVDFTRLGYGRFALNVFGLIAVFMCTGLTFIAFDHLIARRKVSAAIPSATASYPNRRPML